MNENMTPATKNSAQPFQSAPALKAWSAPVMEELNVAEQTLNQAGPHVDGNGDANNAAS